jgi:nuclear polyadenylated RNA-binding protein 3
MTDEAPEFRTKTLSLLSPLPVHPLEPSNIPVLQNQIDPVFNMTSTHIDTSLPHSLVTAPADSQPTIPENPDERTPSADSSFSDAYKEQPAEEQGKEENVKGGDQDREVTDDYAMTFDSDGEERTDSQDLSQANIEHEPESLPVTVPPTDLPPSVSHDHSHVAVPANDQTTHTIPSPSLPASADATAVSFSNGSTVVPNAAEPHVSAESTALKTHTYEAIASGDIDIQQLLDNITANAEKNEPTATTPAQPSTPNSTISKGSSSLPSHASLPPRPQIPQNRNYQDDMQKYHAGPPGVPLQANTYRPVGAPPSLVGAGAPGTSTDPRGGLPPPPVASFRPPSSANPISPSSYNHLNRPPGQGQARPVDVEDEADDIDARWGPDVQNIYDEFLDNERMYVTEGIWDRFPNKSRLFIGKRPAAICSSDRLTGKQVIYHRRKLPSEICSMSSTNTASLLKFLSSKHMDSFSSMKTLRVPRL